MKRLSAITIVVGALALLDLAAAQAGVVVGLDPTSGPPGTRVLVSGSGGPTQGSLRISFIDAAGVETFLTGVTTGADGTFSAAATIPSTAAVGGGKVQISTLCRPQRICILGAAAFNVTGATTTCTCAISLNPTSGPPGTLVIVNGTGFLGSTVSIKFVDAAGVSTTIGSAQISGGNLSTTVSIPSTAAIGKGRVVARNSLGKAKATFAVT